MDDGLLLYVDEQGAQQQARYGTWRMAEGCPRLEPGDTVEFEVAHFPGAPSGHRKAAAAVCFLSKSLQPTPSLEAAAAAAAAAASGGGGSGGAGAGAGAGAGDSMRGRQLGRVQLLKKEFGFIRQVDRLGDMFFHFSQLDGWTADEVKVWCGGGRG
jgi:cold shock CspA family protein